MKPTLLAAAMVLGLLTAAPLFAQEDATEYLECTYTGSWSGKSGTVPINWYGFWFAGDGGWILRGNGSDKFGKSQISAGCGYGDCSFEVKYVSGALKGKRYGFNMLYKGDIPETGPRTMGFSGTWGIGDAYKGGGTWKATPKCKTSTVKDLEKALGWKVFG